MGEQAAKTQNEAPSWTTDNACLISEPLPSLSLDAIPATTMPQQNTSLCEHKYLGICLVTPPSSTETKIFGFSEFVTALALLVVVYTVTDVRYRFRIAVAPIPLMRLTYFLIGLVGFGTLLVDIWFAERWPMPDFLTSHLLWQGFFGGTFLTLAMIWLYYAFINPPVFGRGNYRKFAQALYGAILKGSDNELSVIANELVRSARQLVKLSRQNLPRWRAENDRKKEEKKRKPSVGDYAHDILLLIGNRKLCRHVIASSPVTAIAFFEDMADLEKYEIPIGQFAKNISAEAILNKDSILYHEDEGYNSGLIGYLKPFSQAIYGNYRLVEALGSANGSPLDIDYQVVWAWNATQFVVYNRAVLITLENYLESRKWRQHSYVLFRALENIKNSCRDVYKLDGVSEYYSTDIYRRLSAAVDFVKEAVDLIGRQQELPETRLRLHEEKQRDRDFYDHLADLMFEIIFAAACVKAPSDACWSIHYNTVWNNFFSIGGEGGAWKIIHFKLRRLLYDEIAWREGSLNYKSARILGFCLNVMGLIIDKKRGYDKEYYALHQVVLKWTARNYLIVRGELPDVADACLMGSITFDEQGGRLVKTYIKGLNRDAPKEYLNLIQPSNLNNENQ